MDSTAWIVLGGLVALAMLAAAAVLLVRVFKARKLLVDAGIPLQHKALFWAAVVYTISPVDLIPDPVYLDDIGVLLVALKMLHGAARKAGVGTGKRRTSTP
ncbi:MULTISPECIES: YkvA family protein [unclassified Streptomyces]|uniref:YkvA family protein n=1 Tax=unclassified Streptomyces TaxID=2593676 RepID=UPI00278BB9EB|nr:MULTISPECIES: YkvA family protein [unclassified Streptomyces]